MSPRWAPPSIPDANQRKPSARSSRASACILDTTLEISVGPEPTWSCCDSFAVRPTPPNQGGSHAQARCALARPGGSSTSPNRAVLSPSSGPCGSRTRVPFALPRSWSIKAFRSPALRANVTPTGRRFARHTSPHARASLLLAEEAHGIHKTPSPNTSSVYRIDGEYGSRGGALDCIAALIPEPIAPVLFLGRAAQLVQPSQDCTTGAWNLQVKRMVLLSLSRFAQRVLAPRLR